MKEPLVLKYPDPLPPLTRGITNSVPPRANSPQAHDSNGIEPFSPAFVQTSSYSTTAQMIPNNRLLLQSFWTQTLQRRQRNSNGALHVSAIDTTMGLSDRVESKHTHAGKDFTWARGLLDISQSRLKSKESAILRFMNPLCWELTICGN